MAQTFSLEFGCFIFLHKTGLHFSIWDDRKEKPKNSAPVLFVHGSGPTYAERAFEKQRPLALHYKLLLIDRRGFGESPDVKKRKGDFTDDADDIVEILDEHCQGEGAHIVGHSYGAIGSMLAAAERPKTVRSLTIIEPPLFNLARNHREFVSELIKNLELNLSNARDPKMNVSAAEYWAEFTRIGGLEPPPEAYFKSLSDKEIRGIKTSMTERPPWEASIPLESLASSRFAKLVVSGGWKEAPLEARKRIGAAYMLVCEILQAKLRSQCMVFEEANHSPQQLGEPFNKRLLEFLASQD